MLKDNLKHKRDWLYLIPLFMFIGFAIFSPVNITNDSAQYIGMHIHRDPLYPLFLWVFRGITSGDESYLTLVVWIQNILAWIAIVDITKTCQKIYRLQFIQTILVGALMVSPFVFTPFVAQSGLILTNSVMSEGIAIPMFYFFMASMIRMIETGKTVHVYTSLVLAWLMSLTRGQMQVYIIVWLIVRFFGVIRGREKKMLRVGIALIAFICSFGLRTLSIKAYNLEFNRYFCETTFSDVNVLTNIIYASDMEDLQYIEDEEAARFARLTMEKADEEKMNYKYAPKGLYARGADLEAVHDAIKYKCIDEYWRPVHDAEYPELQADYELETIEQDRIASIIIKSLFPHVLGTWLYDYFALSLFGFLRTVAIASPVFILYAILIFGFIIFSTLRILYKIRFFTSLPLVRLTMLVLLCVCANVFGTATVIMCLSRYMIYMMPFVYVVLLLWVYAWLYELKNRRRTCDEGA